MGDAGAGTEAISMARTVAVARSGDRAAQRRLFETYQAGIFNYLRQMTRDDDLAADLAQETFVRALGRLPKLRSDEAFRAWLYRIAQNLVRDHVAAARPVEAEEAAHELADPASDTARTLEQGELATAVEQAVASLPPPHREVVVLHHLEGLEVAQIAQVLRLRPGTVKSRLARARATLRRKLAPYVEG